MLERSSFQLAKNRGRYSGGTLNSLSNTVASEWLDDIRDRISAAASQKAAGPRDFAATLVGCLVGVDAAVFLHVGDGSAVYRLCDTPDWVVASWPAQGEYAATTYFVTDDPEPKVRLSHVEGRIQEVAVFSDGIERLVLDFSNQTAFAPFFERMFSPLTLRNSTTGSTVIPVEQLRQSWRQADEKWRTSAGNGKFLEIKRRTEDEVRQLQNLGSEESARIAQLGAKVRDAQLYRFLDTYQIAHAKIKGLGTTRKATLRSYGVETAADVQSSRIQQISGFGPSTAGLLIAWRTSIEKRFVFDPRQPINPADIAQVRADVARKKITLEASLQKALLDLRGASSDALTLRNSLKSSAVQIWNRMKQAEADSISATTFFGTAKPTWTFAIVSIVALILTSNLRSPSITKTGTASSPSIPAPNVSNATTNRVVIPEPTIERPQPPRTSAPPIVVSRIEPGLPPRPTIPKEQTVEVPPPNVQVGQQTVVPTVSPFPSPTSLPLVVSESEKERTGRSLQNRQDVIWVQERLKQTGFLQAPATGNWDTASRTALRDFKITNGLAFDDVFDQATSAKLNLPTTVNANRSFIGGWSSEKACPTGVQLEVSPSGARVAGGSCEFRSVMGEQTGWRVQANCRVANESWAANIKLNVRSDRLVWSSERGTATYFKCR